MSSQRWMGLGLTMFAAAATVAMSAPVRSQLPIAPESRIWLEGTSTVRSYSCKASRLSGGADVQPTGAAVATVAEGKHAVQTAEVVVPVAGLACGNSTMDGHLRKALKADANPQIRFRVTDYELTPQASGSAVRMMGRLSIAGQENAVTVSGTASQDANGGLRVRGTKELRMSEFGVKAPTLMMGTLKVGDRVVVHFDMVLRS